MNSAPIKDGLFSTSDSVIKSTSWLTWLSSLVSLVSSSPTISSGSGTPSFTPVKVGDVYCDTSSGKVYMATGNTLVSDWKVLN